jgi:single-stranded-DNA-specific exonuclease
LNETAIAFKIAPKINSSGRLGKAKDAVRLLITDSEEEANRLIMDIESNHSTRKDLTEDAFLTCERVMDNSHNVLIIASHHLHEGIIGICAQKITEKYQKSTCVITIDGEGIGKGSCRSFGDDNILDMLDQSKDLLIKYGGHSQAAGLTILQENIPLLQERLDELAQSTQKPILDIDMEVDIATVSLTTVLKLEKYSFFTGTYLFRGLRLHAKTILGQKHTKLFVEHSHGIIEAIMFNHTEYFYRLEVGDQIDIVGGLSINQWKNRQTMQILIKDLRCDAFQIVDLRSYPKLDLSVISYQDDTVVIDDNALFWEKNRQLSIPPTTKTLIISDLSSLSSAFRRSPKDTLGDIYKLINHHQPLTFARLVTLVTMPNWVIKQFVTVLEELSLIEEDNGMLSIIKSTIKRDVNSSTTYQALLNSKATFDWLSETPIEQIKRDITSFWEDTPCV